MQKDAGTRSSWVLLGAETVHVTAQVNAYGNCPLVTSNGQIILSYSEDGEGDTEREFEEIKYRVSCLRE